MSTLTIYGARGSQPVSGAPYQRYGGRTSCFALERPEGLLIIDAGTGIASLGEALVRRTTLPPITILFTHVHLDHIIGLPTFKPFFRKDARITLMGSSTPSSRWRGALSTIFGKPLWPVGLSEVDATVRFEDLVGRGPRRLCGVQVSWCPVRHPQGALSYRIDTSDGAVVIATDREHGSPRLDRLFLGFCRGADLLLHDAQFLPEEYPTHRGWGHSTWQHATQVAKQAGVGKLVLVSHAPSRSDPQIDRIVQHTTRIFPRTLGATEGLALTLPRRRSFKA
ncbi:MAG: MBL fold metallo-hydrolase [Candidatus Omnitrophica bacterium]|nr:MBL fold metallo-hydrolase [Candidatus Omnitrophota bacterium]